MNFTIIISCVEKNTKQKAEKRIPVIAENVRAARKMKDNFINHFSFTQFFLFTNAKVV